MSVTTIMSLSWGGKIAAALLAILALVLVLAWLDRRAGIDFREFARDVKSDPKAGALYLGLRFLGASLLVGLILAFS